MDENLAGYLMDTLDPATRHKVEVALQSDLGLRARLAVVERVLAPLAEDASDPEPPPLLVLSTLARVAEHKCKLPCAPQVAVACPPPSRWGFRRADALVAALLLVLVGGLLAPFVVQMWRGSSRAACANNLRKFWNGLDGYAALHEGAFPRVEAEGPRSVAGIFVPLLGEAGLLAGVSVECPAVGKREATTLTVEELERMRREQPETYAAAAKHLCGHYAYSLGYDEAHALRGLTQTSGDGLPILADCAGTDGNNSPNHDGYGQNVLYIGGNVRWGTQPKMGQGLDHIYLNQFERREAGVCRTDSVLAPSDARPYQPVD